MVRVLESKVKGSGFKSHQWRIGSDKRSKEKLQMVNRNAIDGAGCKWTEREQSCRSSCGGME